MTRTLVLTALLACGLAGGPARAFTYDAGPVRNRSVVARCMAALLTQNAPASTDVDSDRIAHSIRHFFSAPLDGKNMSKHSGYTAVLPRPPRGWHRLRPDWLRTPLADQRLLRMYGDLGDDRVEKTIRTYRGRTEIEGFLKQQRENVDHLDFFLGAAARPDWQTRYAVSSLARVLVLGGFAAWAAVTSWPLTAVALVVPALPDVGFLGARVKYFVQKLRLPLGGEPDDPTTPRLELGFENIARSIERTEDTPDYRPPMHFGISSILPASLVPYLTKSTRAGDIPTWAFEHLTDLRNPTHRPELPFERRFILSTDYIYAPAADPNAAELTVVNRLVRFTESRVHAATGHSAP